MNETIKYKLVNAIRYFGDAFFYPFFSLYLRSQNLVEDNIGFILSISPIIAIIANPIYSAICNNIKKTKNTLKIVTCLEGLIILTIAFSSNFYLISALTLLMAICGSCHYGLMDSLTSVYSSENNISYSSIRIYGSIAYIIATTLGGYVIDFLGFKASFAIACILFIISGIMYHMIKPIEFDTDSNNHSDNNINNNSDIGNNKNINLENTTNSKLSIFKNKKYVLFIIFYMLLLGTHFSSDGFYSLYLESRGITSNEFGMVYSYFVTFEVLTLIYLNKTKKKFDTNKMLILASLLLITRLICNYLYLDLYIVIAVSALRGIGYAICLHYCYDYVVKIVGAEKGTFAIMMMTLLYSLYLALFNNIFGNIIKNHSYKRFYFVAICLAIIALIIAIIRFIIYRKENLKTNNS